MRARGARRAARVPDLLLAALLLAAHAAGAAPARFAASAYLVTADGQTLWSRHADTPLPPASLTKLMTALLVVEGHAASEVVTVDHAAAHETGTRMRLHTGDRISVGDLLAGALIQSANDACHALADHVAGDEARFVALMNDRARAWGLAHTHFTNACGHDDPEHVASATDLLALAERALQDALLARLVAEPALEVRTVDGRRRFRLHNHNLLIGHYPGIVGVKTGYTPRAGKCLIAAAQQEGHWVMLVMLNAPHRWRDAMGTFERAFAELEYAG